MNSLRKKEKVGQNFIGEDFKKHCITHVDHLNFQPILKIIEQGQRAEKTYFLPTITLVMGSDTVFL